MFRHVIQRQIIRYLHDARADKNFRYVDKIRQQVPKVRLANSRITRTIRDRRHGESQPQVHHDPESPTRYEPYPFAVTEENKIKCLKNVITPLHDIPYEEQLSSKESFCRNALRVFAKELYTLGTPVRMDSRRLPCQVKKIVPSPITDKYRNKDEFSIWEGYDGKTLTVGHMIFPIGKHGNTVCVEPKGVDVIKDETVMLADLVQEFICNQAKLGVCHQLGQEGGWRRFGIRVNIDGELMLIGFLNPRTLRVREVLEERDNFRDFMIRRSQEIGLKLVSLYYQPCPNNKCLHRDVPYELLYGKQTLIESLGKIKVHLSPESYVHNSTPGAEILYETIKSSIIECFGDPEQSDAYKPFILHLDCGAGPLSLYLADMADQVIGIDENERSIDDARLSCKLNDIDNVEFIAAQVEIVIERLLEKFKTNRKEIVALCDLSNYGIHKNVGEVLRHHREVNKLVLIIPKLESPQIMKNLINLCSKSKAKSLPPFAPILSVPVDTCPHTKSFQTILVLERLPE